MSNARVPPLDEMRRMSDAELLALRTSIAYDRGVIAAQVQFSNSDEDDAERQEWRRRAAYAQHVREFGLGCIRNILTERSAARKSEPAVPLARWLETMRDVIDAVRALAAAENDDETDIEPFWREVEEALERYDTFVVDYMTLIGADE